MFDNKSMRELLIIQKLLIKYFFYSINILKIRDTFKIYINHLWSFIVIILHQYGLAVCMSASHEVGHRFVSQPGHTKDYHKNSTNCLPAWHTCFKVGVCQCSLTVKMLGSVCKFIWGHAL